MSYSLLAEGHRGGVVVESSTPQSGYGEEESERAMALGLEIAKVIFLSGVFVDPESCYQVSVSGHRNPGYDAKDEWGDDYVSIQVQHKDHV